MTTTIEHSVLRVSEIATSERIHRDTVISWIEAGQLPARDVRKHGSDRAQWRIDREDWIKFRDTKAAHPKASTIKAPTPKEVFV
jgi:hypothetical protein